MSWLRCDDCDDYFDAKDGNEWRDLGGSITCWNCLQDEEANRDDGDDEPVGPDNYLDDEEALASAGMGMDESYGHYGEES